MKTINQQELLHRLNELKKHLTAINHFSAEQNQYFSKKNQEIDLRINLNNKRSEDYLKIKNRIPDLPQNDLLDILSENTQIHHLKFVLTQEFMEDIYNRLEHMGRAINASIAPIIDYLKSQEGKQNDSSS
jgi:hypothetical protein